VPASSQALRPTSFKELTRTEEKCQEDFGEAYKLGVVGDARKDAPTFTEWMDQAVYELRLRGQDGVFYIPDTAGVMFCMLDEWNKFTPSQVLTWLQNSRATFDEWDTQNLRTSGHALIQSITPELKRRIMNTLGTRRDGPLVLAAIIAEYQFNGASAARLLVAEVVGLKLPNIPGEDVTVLAAKINDYGRRIAGIERNGIPSDFAAIVAACFMDSQSLNFNICVAGLYKEAQARRITWEQVVAEAEDTYRNLVTQNLWVAAKANKEVAALMAENAALRSQLQAKSPVPAPDSKSPVVDAPSNESKNKIRRTPPKDGEPTTKTMFGMEHKYCAKCRRWTYGTKIHSTDEHKPKNPTSVPPTPPGAGTITNPTPAEDAAAAHFAAPQSGLVLHGFQ
jgi:hypothetical protein